MAEGVESLLAIAYARAAVGSAAQVYAQANALTLTGTENLEQVVNRKLTLGGKSAQIKDSLLETLRAGGAVGESVEECLLKTGLTGWS